MIDGTVPLVDPLAAAEAALPPQSTTAAAPTAAHVPATTGPKSRRPGELPTYTRSLLRIQVPVTVTLARKRQPLGHVVELGPGAIIHFDKSCEQMLDLEVGNRAIAQGEAVKVGDKFGLRITAMILPEERFQPVKKHAPRTNDE